MYSRKMGNGPFASPIVSRPTKMFEEAPKVRPFSPTYAKTTIFDDTGAKYRPIRSGYKNCSNFTIGSMNDGFHEPPKKRHFQKDRDLYNSNIFVGENLPQKVQKKVLESKYST